MDGIRSWAFAVCAAAICGAVLDMLLPEGGAQKTYKAVFCIFFLLVTVSPIMEIELPDLNKITADIENYEGDKNEFEQSSANIVEQKILDDTKMFLEEKNIAVKDVLIKVNILENGSIDINKFVLTLWENPVGLSKEVAQKIGIEPEIIISGETKNGNS